MSPGFFETPDGAHGGTFSTYRFIGVNDELLAEAELSADKHDFSVSIAPVVAASPGAFVHVVTDECFDRRPTEDDLVLTESPVVAWRISPYGAEPVLDTLLATNQTVFLSRPDGEVSDSWSSTFSDIKAALTDLLATKRGEWDAAHGGKKFTVVPADQP